MTSGRRRWVRPLIIAPVVVAAIGVLYVGVTFVQVWHAARQDRERPAEAIVVMGAAQYDGRPSPVLRARLDRAYELYLEGYAPRIITTGGRQEGDRFTEAYAGYGYLRRLGVPDDDLMVVVDGTNSYEELVATARQLRQLGEREVIIVSDGYHAFRLGEIAREVGLDASVARVGGAGSMRSLVRETAAVSAGRLVGYRRLSAWR